MTCLSNNLLIISKRWLDLANLIKNAHYELSQVALVEDHERSLVFEQIQIASSFDQISEANLQISAVAVGSSEVTVYGTGLGQVQRQLLARGNLKKLNVVILNLAVFKASLYYFNQLDWLQDPRVKLQLPSNSNPLVNQINTPFVALPAELTLASNETALLRDRICLALDADFIEQSSGAKNQALFDKIDTNLSFIRRDHDVSKLFSSATKTNYIICGAGPTLIEHFHWLKQAKTKKDYTLISVDAAVKALYQEGIVPDIIVSIDPRAKHLFDGFNEKVPLVYFPVVDDDFLSTWQGERYVAYSTGALYQPINNIEPRGRLYCGGSVIHPAIDLAVNMKAENIILLGADFSFPDGRTHAYWQEDSVHISATNTSHWVLNFYNERIPTLLNYRGYLRDLEQYIALTKNVTFYNGSKKGALIAGTEIWTEMNEE